jgi:hypothetical protein
MRSNELPGCRKHSLPRPHFTSMSRGFKNTASEGRGGRAIILVIVKVKDQVEMCSGERHSLLRNTSRILNEECVFLLQAMHV